MKRLALALPALFLPNCTPLAAREPDHPARLIQESPPTYPADMMIANAIGVMELTFDVEANGTIKNVMAFGTMTPHQIRSSLAQVHRLKYDPAVVNGHPAEEKNVHIATTQRHPLPAPVVEIDPSWNVHAFVQGCPADQAQPACQVIPVQVSGSQYRLPAGTHLPGIAPEEIIIGRR